MVEVPRNDAAFTKVLLFLGGYYTKESKLVRGMVGASWCMHLHVHVHVRERCVLHV